MQHEIIMMKHMYIEDEKKRLWASAKPVAAGSTLYDVFVQPNAGSGHHMQLTITEIDALSTMLAELTVDII